MLLTYQNRSFSIRAADTALLCKPQQYHREPAQDFQSRDQLIQLDNFKSTLFMSISRLVRYLQRQRAGPSDVTDMTVMGMRD
jgi:hypothetical protein